MTKGSMLGLALALRVLPYHFIVKTGQIGLIHKAPEIQAVRETIKDEAEIDQEKAWVGDRRMYDAFDGQARFIIEYVQRNEIKLMNTFSYAIVFLVGCPGSDWMLPGCW